MKTDRLIGILSVLLQEEKTTAPALAEKFEVSRRTIMRDLEEIASLGNAEALRFLQKELNTDSPYSSRNTPVILLYLEQLIREE
jgi:DeoR/GlpR family transcriptional regulator of sugar metabolism